MRYVFFILFLAFQAYSADFATYLGNQYQVTAVATDLPGNTYVTGVQNLPPNSNPPSNIFVAKLDPSGNIVFTTTLGPGFPGPCPLALDPAGNVWVGYPLGLGLVKVAANGKVISSVSFPGAVYGIAIDPNSNLYLTGRTVSNTFPTTPGLPNDSAQLNEGLGGTAGAFITKLDPTGSKFIYSAVIAAGPNYCGGGSTCFLSMAETEGVAITLDAAGDALVAGNTNTIHLPITPGAATGYGAFAVKINAGGNQMDYLTYLGPPNGDVFIFGPTESITASAIATDAAGNAYLTGSTNDTKFPATPGAFQTTLSGDLTQDMPTADAFAMKLTPLGSVTWATFLGGPASDSADGIGLNGAGNVWLAGTNGAGFPTPSPGVVAAPGDFLAELSPDGSKLLNEAEFASGSEGQALATDPNGVLHLAGADGLVWTIMPGLPLPPRVLGVVNAAGGQISEQIAPGEIVSIFGTGLGPEGGASPTLVNGRFPTSVEGVQVLLNGAPIPLIYVSATQINAEIPAPLTAGAGDALTLQVVNGSQTVPDFRATVDATIFAIFQNPDGSIAAINQDGTVNSSTNPAKPGTIIAMWATGLTAAGATIDGAITSSADNWCASCQFSIGVTTETAAYAGAAPGLIDGAMQINLLVPVQKGANKLQVFYKGGVYGIIYASE